MKNISEHPSRFTYSPQEVNDVQSQHHSYSISIAKKHHQYPVNCSGPSQLFTNYKTKIVLNFEVLKRFCILPSILNHILSHKHYGCKKIKVTILRRVSVQTNILWEEISQSKYSVKTGI